MIASRHTGWIGFDFGAASVKVAQVVRQDGKYRIRSASIVQRREPWNGQAYAENRPLSSRDELSAAASLCSRLQGSAVAAMAPTAMCDVTSIDVPSAQRGRQSLDLLKAIEAETHRSMRDRVYASWPVGLQAGRVNVAATPRGWSEQISDDVAGGGWNCQLIDVLPWALTRAVSMTSPKRRDRIVAALDWGYGRSTMTLICNGAPAIVRTLRDCAFQNVIDLVAKELRLDHRDAETLLFQYNRSLKPALATTPEGDVLSQLLADPLKRLTENASRTLSYWQNALRGKLPETIYLFGGGGALSGVAARLAKSLRVSVEPWRLPTEQDDAVGLLPTCMLGAAVGMSAAAWGEV